MCDLVTRVAKRRALRAYTKHVARAQNAFNMALYLLKTHRVEQDTQRVVSTQRALWTAIDTAHTSIQRSIACGEGAPFHSALTALIKEKHIPFMDKEIIECLGLIRLKVDTLIATCTLITHSREHPAQPSSE